ILLDDGLSQVRRRGLCGYEGDRDRKVVAVFRVRQEVEVRNRDIGRCQRSPDCFARRTYRPDCFRQPAKNRKPRGSRGRLPLGYPPHKRLRGLRKALMLYEGGKLLLLLDAGKRVGQGGWVCTIAQF